MSYKSLFSKIIYNQTLNLFRTGYLLLKYKNYYISVEIFIKTVGGNSIIKFYELYNLNELFINDE